GWCAIRTKDVITLGEKGAIIDPRTGAIEQVTSVDQVTSWIPRSVTFDQIVESVGAVNASEYAVISERKLWSTRVSDKVKSVLNRRLSVEEKDAIESSIETAEIIRSVMTQRYIRFV